MDSVPSLSDGAVPTLNLSVAAWQTQFGAASKKKSQIVVGTYSSKLKEFQRLQEVKVLYSDGLESQGACCRSHEEVLSTQGRRLRHQTKWSESSAAKIF